MTPREIIREHAYPVLGAISAISLVLISVSLVPIARWARTQNECVERTFRSGGINNAGLPAKVWSCNGGGD